MRETSAALQSVVCLECGPPKVRRVVARSRQPGSNIFEDLRMA